jgi:hypothetical protein
MGFFLLRHVKNFNEFVDPESNAHKKSRQTRVHEDLMNLVFVSLLLVLLGFLLHVLYSVVASKSVFHIMSSFICLNHLDRISNVSLNIFIVLAKSILIEDVL